MPSAWVYALVGISIAALVAGLTPALIKLLIQKDILDNPNERSSHTIPTPRGGGWLALGLPILALIAAPLILPTPPGFFITLYALAGGLVLTMCVSGLDDRFSLGTRVRLAAQLVASVAAVLFLPESVRVLPLLPDWLETICLVLGLVWMMNLTNFIDGINGITAVNGIATAAGMAVLGMGSVFLPLSGALLIGGLAGFLVWNWGQAKIFMGDVGSVPLGLWLGFGLILVAAQFGLIPALLLAFYPVMDASYTLIRRAIRRQKIWQAHREHFYQQAVQNGRTHAMTSTLIALFNALCIGLAILAVLYPPLEYAALVAAIAALLILWRIFSRPVPSHA